MSLFLMPDPADLIGLNFCSDHGEVVTAHKKSGLYKGLLRRDSPP